MVLAAWGLFALTVGALHLWIVPRINDWRPELESWATRAVGVPVKVGAIRARTAVAGDGGSAGFLPSPVPAFELTDVRLFDPAGREALHLPSVQAAVSVPSLWRLGFEQLVIASPVLDVRRTAEGALDNGIAVATNLAIMEDRTLVHGPLELLFTADEERGLKGAGKLDPALLTGRGRFVEIPRAVHTLHEDNPEAVLAALKDFLEF